MAEQSGAHSGGSCPWRYRCSICGELFTPDQVSGHLEVEKAKPSWPGVMHWTREDEKGRGVATRFDT